MKNENKMRMLALLIFLSGPAFARDYTNYYYNWTGTTGDGCFNTEGNWEEESYETTSSVKPIFRFPHEGTVGAQTILSADFVTNRIEFTNQAGRATTVLNLNGHLIQPTEAYTFANGSPLVLKNGAFMTTNNKLAIGWGADGMPQPDVRFENMTFQCINPYTASYVKLKGSKTLYFKDSISTNFPSSSGVCSNDRIVFDNSTYSKVNGNLTFGFPAGTTNAVVRFSNGSRTENISGTYAFAQGSAVTNNRIIVDSGSVIPRLRGYVTHKLLNGFNNILAVTNATVGGGMDAFGEQCQIILSDSTYNEPKEAPSFKGIGHRLVLSGKPDFNVSSVSFTETTNCQFVVEDNTVVTNCNFILYTYTQIRDFTVSVGTNSHLRMNSAVMYSAPGRNPVGALSTNVFFIVGEDSTLTFAGNSGNFRGYNTRLILNNGTFVYNHETSYFNIYAGTTMEFNGDKARFVGRGYNSLGILSADHPDMTGFTLKFRPGTTGYDGEPPMQLLKLNAYSSLNVNTEIEADLSEFAAGKSAGHYRIPLISGNPQTWKNGFRPDMERLTERLSVSPAGQVTDAQVLYDTEKDAICLDFNLIDYVGDDGLQVVGEPGPLGSVQPAYGIHSGYASGDEIVCSATADETCQLKGWRLLDANGEQLSTGGPTNIVIRHPGKGLRLVWEWTPNFSVAVSSDGRGTVTASDTSVCGDGWHSCTLTATPNDGQTFYAWTGDVPEGMSRINPLTFIPGGDVALMATFRTVRRVNVPGDAATIADAVAALTGLGDDEIGEVVLGKGVHEVAAPVTLAARLTVRGATGRAEDVTVRAVGATGIFRITNGEAVLRDLTVCGGVGTGTDEAGGLWMTAAGLAQNCVFASNACGGSKSAGAVSMSAGTLSGCIVTGNFASVDCERTPGVYAYGGETAPVLVVDSTVSDNFVHLHKSVKGCGLRMHGGTVRNCRVTGNYNLYAEGSGAGGICVEDGTVRIERTLVAGNYGGYNSSYFGENTEDHQAAGISVSAGLCTVVDSTIAGNVGVIRGGVFCRNGARLLIENSIIYENQEVGYDHLLSADSKFTRLSDENIAGLARVDAQNAQTVVGSCTTIDFQEDNVTCDPLFADPDCGDWRLAANSPCLGKGYTQETGPAVVRTEVPLVEPKPGDDLRAAVRSCAEGGVVRLADGAYPVVGTIVVRKGVRIESANGPGRTSLYGAAADGSRMFLLDHPDAVLSGVTLSNAVYRQFSLVIAGAVRGGLITNCVFTENALAAASQYGGALVKNYDGRVVDCVFCDNTGGGGHFGNMLFASGPKSLVQGCSVYNNRHTSNNTGGEPVRAGGGILNRCVVTNNVCANSVGTGIRVFGAMRVQNTLIADNKSTWQPTGTPKAPALTVVAANAIVENCTIVGNTGGSCGGLTFDAYAGVCVNTVCTGNVSPLDQKGCPNVSATVAVFSNCLFETATEISGGNFIGCRTGNPGFVRMPPQGDYDLTSASICRGAGILDVGWTELPPRDVLGRERSTTSVDIGAYAFCASDELACSYTVEGTETIGAPLVFHAVVTGASLDGLECRWLLTTGSEADEWSEWTSALDYGPLALPPGKYGMRLQVRTPTEHAETTMEGVLVRVPTARMYLVSADVPDHIARPPFDTEDTAATNLADLVGYGASGSEVIVLPGLHRVFEEADFGYRVTVRGRSGDPRDAVIVRAWNTADLPSAHILNLPADGSWLSGVTISNGYASAQMFAGNSVFIGQGTVSNCVITHTSGGGSAVQSQGGTVVDCSFSHCSGGYGGPVALVQDGEGAVTRNCRFTDCSLTYYGIAVAAVNGGLMDHCQIVDNNMSTADPTYTSGWRGAGLSLNGGTLRDCLIAGNRANQGFGGISVAGASGKTISIVNCTVVSNGVKIGRAGGIRFSSNRNCQLYVTNTIVFGNYTLNVETTGVPEQAEWSADADQKIHLVNTLIAGFDDIAGMSGSSAEGCFSGNPGFRNPERGDYRLAAQSPCIDTGVNWPGCDADTDLRGRPRRCGPRTDVGCYEFSHGLMILVR